MASKHDRLKLTRHEVPGRIYWEAERFALVVKPESGLSLAVHRDGLEREDVDTLHRVLEQASAELDLARRRP